MKIGARIKEARAGLNLKQEDVAAQSGIPIDSLRKYEGDRSQPGTAALAGLVSVGMNANWLLTGEGPMMLADLAPGGSLDTARLQLAVETVEEGLKATKRTMTPAKKAELVLAVYDLYAGGVGAQVKERILRLVKTAAQ